MQGKDYIFAIQDKSFNFYQPDGDGNIILTSRPYFLRFAPSGWEDIAIQVVRNKTYWALERSVTIPFDYVRDGAAIIKDVFYDLDLEKGLYLSILSQRLDFDKVGGNINVNTLLPDQPNECIITGEPGQVVYLKLIPSSVTQVEVFIDPGDGMYHQFGLLTNGDPSVFSLTMPATGEFRFKLYFTGDNISAQMSMQNGSTIPEYGYWYKQIFRGEIDLTQFTHEGFKVTAPTLEDGITKHLKANENTEYEFGFDEYVNVEIDGIGMHEKLNYKPVDGISVSRSVYGTQISAGITFLSNEGDSSGMAYASQILQATTANWSERMASENSMLKNVGNKPVEINLSGNIEFKCTGMTSLPPYAVKMRFERSLMPIDPANQDRYLIISTVAMVVGQTYGTNFDITLTLQPNEKLFFQIIYFGGVGTEAVIEFTENNSIAAKFITKRDTTFVKAFRPQHLFEKLIERITDSEFTAGISHFLTQRQNIVFTSSNAIRNLPDATLKMSFSNFFKFWDSVYSVALTPDIRLEQKEDAIDFTDPIVLPSPEDESMVISVDTDYLFNELHIGYPEIGDDVGTLNGNEEWNTKTVFNLGATAEPKVLDKISPVKASCYTIEKIRITQLDKDTTAYSTDNDAFVLHVESILHPAVDDIPEYYRLDRSLNATAEGLLEPQSVFNLALSPKRMLINNAAFLHSSLLLNESRVLKFISSGKNDKVVSGGIVEKADVTLGALKKRFFHPIMFAFQVAPPLDMDEILTPGRGFVFDFNGNWYFGIADNISYSTQRSLRSFRLLSYAMNDLKKLKEYNG